MNSNAYGIFSKVPPEERLVAEERDCWAHARAARELPFPERLPGTELGPVILRAIDIIIDLGPDLERNKRDRRALRPSGRGLGGGGSCTPRHVPRPTRRRLKRLSRLPVMYNISSELASTAPHAAKHAAAGAHGTRRGHWPWHWQPHSLGPPRHGLLSSPFRVPLCRLAVHPCSCGTCT